MGTTPVHDAVVAVAKLMSDQNEELAALRAALAEAEKVRDAYRKHAEIAGAHSEKWLADKTKAEAALAEAREVLRYTSECNWCLECRNRARSFLSRPSPAEPTPLGTMTREEALAAGVPIHPEAIGVKFYGASVSSHAEPRSVRWRLGRDKTVPGHPGDPEGML